MKSLITGGAGFIGSNLADKLIEQGHEIVVLDNLSTGHLSNLDHLINKIEFVNIDISNNQEGISKYFNKVDWVFHMAGLADMLPSIKEPNKYFKTNVTGTLNVLNSAKKHKIKKLVYMASASCYGIPEKYPTNEQSKIDPQYPYALTKFLGEKLVIHWAKVYNMPNVSLRLFNAYGPRSGTKSAYGSVFAIFLAQKLAKKSLTVVGDGNQTRDFIHVYDLVEAIIKSAQKGKNGEIYNVGRGKETSINFIANLIGGNKISVSKRPNETDRSLADISKIKKQLNWQPKIEIETGVNMLLKNINDWKEAQLWTAEKIKEINKTWFEFLDKS
ncbi:MAG: SDR family NAD(P)-dependent oxidoreductase [SAR202 cluster bacterium]|nr:SDR family NAD(P)-dependent oxidoreductase [SAR202 cluster bacterium]